MADSIVRGDHAPVGYPPLPHRCVCCLMQPALPSCCSQALGLGLTKEQVAADLGAAGLNADALASVALDTVQPRRVKFEPLLLESRNLSGTQRL